MSYKQLFELIRKAETSKDYYVDVSKITDKGTGIELVMLDLDDTRVKHHELPIITDNTDALIRTMRLIARKYEDDGLNFEKVHSKIPHYDYERIEFYPPEIYIEKTEDNKLKINYLRFPEKFLDFENPVLFIHLDNNFQNLYVYTADDTIKIFQLPEFELSNQMKIKDGSLIIQIEDYATNKILLLQPRSIQLFDLETLNLTQICLLDEMIQIDKETIDFRFLTLVKPKREGYLIFTMLMVTRSDCNFVTYLYSIVNKKLSRLFSHLAEDYQFADLFLSSDEKIVYFAYRHGDDYFLSSYQMENSLLTTYVSEDCSRENIQGEIELLSHKISDASISGDDLIFELNQEQQFKIYRNNRFYNCRQCTVDYLSNSQREKNYYRYLTHCQIDTLLSELRNLSSVRQTLMFKSNPYIDYEIIRSRLDEAIYSDQNVKDITEYVNKGGDKKKEIIDLLHR